MSSIHGRTFNNIFLVSIAFIDFIYCSSNFYTQEQRPTALAYRGDSLFTDNLMDTTKSLYELLMERAISCCKMWSNKLQ